MDNDVYMYFNSDLWIYHSLAMYLHNHSTDSQLSIDFIQDMYIYLCEAHTKIYSLCGVPSKIP